jgi:hypothetical protein
MILQTYKPRWVLSSAEPSLEHSVLLQLACHGPEFTVQNDEVFVDPEGLTW